MSPRADIVPPAPSLSMQTPRVGPVSSSVTDRFCPANATRPTLSFRVSLLIVLWEIGLGWFVERPLLVIEEIDSLSFFLLFFLRGIDFKVDRENIINFFTGINGIRRIVIVECDASVR